MNMLAKAIRIVALGFENKVDKGGQPYFLHCMRVMNAMDTEDEKIVAILHDAVEDNVITYEELRKEGFSDSIIQDVRLLTHEVHIDYDIYIRILSNSYRASKVKRADLKDNGDLTRLKVLRKKDLDCLEKYHRAWVHLSSVK